MVGPPLGAIPALVCFRVTDAVVRWRCRYFCTVMETLADVLVL